ncbi:MAG: peptide methionine sulfoxide reductase msrA/msrB [Patescibacteria group bacterium]|jgi:methionine-S-sulfoxide reductase|nr:peptide methionine sulfoxide reductase msrA/msrB [Patescibacteria group bacterium]
MASPTNSPQEATFAGGCFWCLEPAFAQLEGISDLKVGYSGGKVANPTEMQVHYEDTGHYEVLHVVFDPQKISYQQLLDTFWRQIDPTDPGGQFHDRGQSYQTAIFYHTDQQKKLAEASKEKMDQSGIFPKPIVTKILPAKPFYEAEDYHQQYYKKNPMRYQLYSFGSGRKGFLKKTWDNQDD